MEEVLITIRGLHMLADGETSETAEYEAAETEDSISGNDGFHGMLEEEQELTFRGMPAEEQELTFRGISAEEQDLTFHGLSEDDRDVPFSELPSEEYDPDTEKVLSPEEIPDESREESAPIELVTKGTMHTQNGLYFISYTEQDEGEPYPTRNLIKIGKDSVELVRKGITGVHMIFGKNRTQMTGYDTPYGSIPMEIHTTQLETRIREEAMEIDICYALIMGGISTSDCRLQLQVRRIRDKERTEEACWRSAAAEQQ